ncbi:MAG: hypothetical protein ACE5JL_10945 [Dehalococcoidia bacterium]
MALRLAGEECSVVQGLDGLGWLRDISVSSSDPAVTITQQGSGPVLRGKDASGTLVELLNSGLLSWLTGAALEAGKYQIGRNAGNNLQYNVPFGSTHNISVNNVSIITAESGQVTFGDTVLKDFRVPQATKTANYTATATDKIIGVDTTGGAVTITLPTAETTAGRTYVVKDQGGSAGTNNITVATEGAQTIDGSATDAISANYGSQGYYSDGTNWFKV